MTIGIDARLIDETGVGRYIKNLIAQLSVVDTTNGYVVFLPSKAFGSFKPPNARWKKVEAPVRWHTLAEQFVMPRLFAQARCDIVHIPYHNPPVFYSGSMILTIHDLIILHFDTGKATTLPTPLYKLKRLGYFIELWIGLRKAKHIIAVSEATKQEIIGHFGIQPEKITVTYEGVDEHITAAKTKKTTPALQKIIEGQYILYVGNAYPHKNLDALLQSFVHLRNKDPQHQMKLVLVGSDDFFYQRLRMTAGTLGLSDVVIFFGQANDADLYHLYTHARAFIFPSLMEGFGLPALEALSLGCPVIVSDIPVFHEILGDAARYINSRDPKAIADAILDIQLSANKRRAQLSGVPYNWRSMAEHTLALYERSIRL